MTVIAFVGNKGGAGKTTLTVNFAAGLAEKHKVVIIDADPQGSSYQWSEMAEKEKDFSVYLTHKNLDKLVKDLSGQYDYIVIDCPPYVQSPQTAEVLKIADIALIPVQPSPMDIWATVHIEEVVESSKLRNRGLKANLVINQLEPRTTFSKLMREALSEIKFPVLDSAVRRRAIYKNTALEGKSVFDLGKAGDVAKEEMNALINEVEKL